MIQLGLMKYFTAIFSLIFVFIALFGFAILCHDAPVAHAAISMENMETESGNCLISNMADCATEGLPMAIQHISAYQSFSNVTVLSFMMAVAVLFFGFVLIYTFSKKIFETQVPAFAYIYRRWRETSQATFQTQKFTRWLSLFENSPSFI